VGGSLALAAALPGAAQGAALEPPLAASGNVHLLDHVPGSAAGMNFKDHYAFVSGWGGITVLDIAQADAPRVAGTLPLPHFENEDVDLCGNTLIVVNDREATDIGALMYVISIAQPTSPTVSAVLPLGLTGEGRGSDVIRIDKGGIGGTKVKAPVAQSWFGLPTADAASFQAHPVYGFMCPILKPEVDTP
jgi:hypothetical protein